MRLARMLATAVPFLLSGTALSAQSLWPTPLEGRAEFGLEWVRPTFVDNDNAFGFTRGVWILSGRVRASERINVVLALPQMRAPAGSSGGSSSSSAGAPYVGVEFLAQGERRPEFELGIRVGGSSSFGADPSTAMALYGDFDRWEEALHGATSIHLLGHFTPWEDSTGASARVRFGGTILRSNESYGGSTMYLDYGIRFGRHRPDLRLGAALTGRWALNGGAGSFAQASVHQATGELSFGGGMIRPSIGVRVPLDEMLDQTVRFVLIGGVTVALR